MRPPPRPPLVLPRWAYTVVGIVGVLLLVPPVLRLYLWFLSRMFTLDWLAPCVGIVK